MPDISKTDSQDSLEILERRMHGAASTARKLGKQLGRAVIISEITPESFSMMQWARHRISKIEGGNGLRPAMKSVPSMSEFMAEAIRQQVRRVAMAELAAGREVTNNIAEYISER
jgi:hypothetical protein